jgi:hypothetical protein
MKNIPNTMRLLAAALFVSLLPHTVSAGSADYEFHLAETSVAQGPEAVVTFLLKDKRTGKPVSDAVIFATRLDMAPEGMEAMTTTLEPLPSNEAGVYRFKANISMEGEWRFKLALKVQGEPETIQGELVLQVKP